MSWGSSKCEILPGNLRSTSKTRNELRRLLTNSFRNGRARLWICRRGLGPYRGQIATNKRQVARARFRSTPETRSRRNSRIWPLRGQIFSRIDGGIQQGQGPQQNASARPGCVPAASRLRPGCVPAASRLRPVCVPAFFENVKTCPPRYDCHRNPNEPPPKTVLEIELNPSRSLQRLFEIEMSSHPEKRPKMVPLPSFGQNHP